jgi:hypothetical protein
MKCGLEWSWPGTRAEAQSTLLSYSMIKSLYGKQITIVLELAHANLQGIDDICRLRLSSIPPNILTRPAFQI